MAPKEKAKEIYCKYTDALNIRDLQLTANPFAKRCALIAVDEVFEFMKMDDDFHKDAHFANSKWVRYWFDVKQEIEKL